MGLFIKMVIQNIRRKGVGSMLHYAAKKQRLEPIRLPADFLNEILQVVVQVLSEAHEAAVEHGLYQELISQEPDERVKKANEADEETMRNILNAESDLKMRRAQMRRADL